MPRQKDDSGGGASRPLVELEGVTRTFTMGEVDVPVLRGVDAQLYPDEISVILGESGSGKTTLLNIIGGLDAPTSGAVRVGGEDIAGYSPRRLTRYRREHVGVVFQLYNLIPSLTALENVTAATELVDDPLSPREALETVELGGYEDHFPSQLSGGQQQRVSIARAIAKRPGLLLCDEPTGALDHDTSIHILQLLADLNARRGATVVMITHSAEIARVGHRRFYLKDGVVERVLRQSPELPEETSA